ncbi:MAG TPA: membrane dipeptidase [Chthoniobacteraceae bacterium]|nr:membrane dipeptidase [Chthoniobacteraceae bacterium]
MTCLDLPPVTHPAFTSAWEIGLAKLQPTPGELEHGLKLHRSLTICEHYGFLPSGWDRAAIDHQHAGTDGQSYTDFVRRQSYLRTTAMVRSESAREEVAAALDQAGVHAIVVPANDYGETLEDAIGRMAAFQQFYHHLPDRLFPAGDVAGIERARARNATAVIYSLTGMPIFGAGDMLDPTRLLQWVEIWHSMGVRFMHLSYNRRNLFANGCTETGGGISDLGRDLITMMNRTGVIVDVPHSNRETLLDAVRLSSGPVIASHTGCQAVHDGLRCKSDEELKAIASTGGYIGIFSVPQLLGENADINLMLRHVEHAVNVVGPEHVVIGTDVGHTQPAPETLKPAAGGWRRRIAGGWNEGKPLAPWSNEHTRGSLAWTNRPLFTVGLVKMGLSDDAIAQIHYGNLRRVLSSLDQNQRG